MPDPQFIFVYGSLMRGLDLHHSIEGGTFVCEATTNGMLVNLGRYPGLVDGPGRVRGELYRFDDMPGALDILDDIEEYDPTDAGLSVYLRVARSVTTEDGREVLAWVYVYNRSAKGAARIEGGDWRRAQS